MPEVNCQCGAKAVNSYLWVNGRPLMMSADSTNGDVMSGTILVDPQGRFREMIRDGEPTPKTEN